jgi:hypothetical protein
MEVRMMMTRDIVDLEIPHVVVDRFNMNDQEGRIRVALGIERGPLPAVESKWLYRYYDYLTAHLLFPFHAEYAEEKVGYRSVVSPVEVVALLHPDEHRRHEDFGLLCRAFRGAQELELPLSDVELIAQPPNNQLIEDYWYWFWNWRFDPKI